MNLGHFPCHDNLAAGRYEPHELLEQGGHTLGRLEDDGGLRGGGDLLQHRRS
mgnify:CR=1 FL=1